MDFFCPKKFEPSGGANADRKGRKRRQGSRRQRAETPGMSRQEACECRAGSSPGVGFVLWCVRLWRHAAGGHRNGVCLANVARRLSVAECRNNRSGAFWHFMSTFKCVTKLKKFAFLEEMKVCYGNRLKTP